MKKRADGRWLKQKRINGETINFYSKEKTEKAALRDIENQMIAYSEGIKKGPLFAQIADEWWEDAYDQLAYQSAKSYRPALQRAKERFKNTYIKNITVRDINAFLNNMGRQGFAHKTVSNQKCVISLIFEYAIIKGVLEYNICKSVTLPKNLKKTERAPASEIDEIKTMISADIWIFPFIAIYTGMRKGEILALQWRDIDFEKNLIRVTKSVEHIGDKPRIKPPKTKAGIRLVPLPLPLKEHFLKTKGDPEHFIVSDDGKSPLTNRRYITLSKHYREATGTNFTAHQLRHSYATIAIENDIDPKSLQSVLGHEQISTTLNTYAAFREKGLIKVSGEINQMFSKKLSQTKVESSKNDEE